MSTEESVDPRLVEQAQTQIRGLVDEIVALAKQDCAPEVFFGEFLNRVVAALAAVGGAVWSPGESGGVELQYQVNFREANMPERQEDLVSHRRLVQQAFNSGEGTMISPHSGSAEQGANPTDYLLVLGPVRVGKETKSVVEIFQRPNPSIKTQRGYLRFLQQMCELAGDYLRNRQLRHYTDRQAMYGQLEQFSRSVHGSLDPREVAFTIVNEGRRLVDCDRVTVALRKGKKCKVEAISGQDTFDTRSNTVTLLNKLASTVVASGEPVWFSGDATNLAPQIEEAVQEYVDDSHSKQVGVIPLRRPLPVGTNLAEAEESLPLGALIIEMIEDIRPREGMMQRVEIVREHSAAALGNALQHHHLFLMPVWSALGKSRWLVEAQQLPKTVSIGIALVIATLAAFFVPYSFNLNSTGRLEPVMKRDVFAPLDGTVEDVHVKHGVKVQEGQLLVQLRSTDLEVKLEDVDGQLAGAREQLFSIDRQTFDEGKRMQPDEKNRLAGDRAELKEKVLGLERQRKLLSIKKEQLKVLSPLTGEVATWNVEELLAHRPVRQGQVLLTVDDSSGEWELELKMPEDKAGYLTTAQHDFGNDLKVTYRLATDPGVDHEGKVKEVDIIANVFGEEGNMVRVKVAIDKHDLDYLRPGADVMAKIHCGKRSLGYVWLHDVINFIHSRVLFKL